MSNTPETEVLRIEGNVTVPKGIDRNLIRSMILSVGYEWSGNITDQDSPTGMRLYRVEEVEGFKNEIAHLWTVINQLNGTAEANDKAFLSLSEELKQEKNNRRDWEKAFDLLEQKCINQSKIIGIQSDTITALEKRLEQAEQTRWRTFTKWWKELW